MPVRARPQERDARRAPSVSREAPSLTHDIDLPAPVESAVMASARAPREKRAAVELADLVTLVVTAWHNVEPGVLSWSFPSFASALAAAGALRNAVEWLIVEGAVVAGRDGAIPQGAVVLHRQTR